MLGRPAHHALAAFVGAAITVMWSLTAGSATAGPAAAAGPAGGPTIPAGPPYEYTTELMGGDGYVIPLKDKAMLTRTPLGYLYRAGQQDGHLVISLVNGKLRFADRGTATLVELPGACQRSSVKVGIAAVCKVPSTITDALPLLVEVWPRLGDDFTDGSTLPANIAMTVLSDEGNDVALLGAGPDFFNGHKGHDRVVGGDGNDWIRGGLGDDTIYAGPGNDQIIGMEGDDFLRGGSGNDRLGGMENNDQLEGGAGADVLLCGDGADRAAADASDKVFDCESVTGW